MKLRFVWVGKTRSGPVLELVDDYLKRIGRYAACGVSELRESAADGSRVTENEGERILEATKSDPLVVLLDERGRQFTSTEFASLIRKHMEGGTKQLTFVIGGHLGTSAAVKSRADLVLSLSSMTFTHEMARALLTEQVYRAFTIINNLPYQK